MHDYYVEDDKNTNVSYEASDVRKRDKRQAVTRVITNSNGSVSSNKQLRLGLFSHCSLLMESSLTAASRPPQSSTASVPHDGWQHFLSTEPTRCGEQWWVLSTDENRTTLHRLCLYIYIYIYMFQWHRERSEKMRMRERGGGERERERRLNLKEEEK